MKNFTLWLITYGVPRDGNGRLLFQRAIDSVIAHTDRASIDIFVGLNACKGDDAVRLYASHLLGEGKIDMLVESDRNIGKEGMFTLMLQHTSTPFVVRMDDDTHVHGDWLGALEREIAYGADVAEWGRVSQIVPVGAGASYQDAYRTFLGADDLESATMDKMPLAGVKGISGGFVCTRTNVLRETGYPHNDFAPIYAEDNVHSMALHQAGYTARNIPAFWNTDLISFGDERGVGSRTNRSEPREIFDGNMDGITITRNEQ